MREYHGRALLMPDNARPGPAWRDDVSLKAVHHNVAQGRRNLGNT